MGTRAACWRSMSTKRARLLIVDDDSSLEAVYRDALSQLGVSQADFETTAEAALKRINNESFDALVAAIHPPALDGIELLRLIRESDPQLPAVLVADRPSIDSA